MDRTMVEKVLLLTENWEENWELEKLVMLAIELSETDDITMASEKVEQLMNSVEEFSVENFKRIVGRMDARMNHRVHEGRVISQGGL